MAVNPDYASLTAFERARVAYELMRRHQRDAAIERQQRERGRAVRAAVVLAAALMLLIGVAVYSGWLPEALRAGGEPASTRAADRSFRETRTGQVRSFYKGDTCQELLFSNDQGRYVGGSLVDCDSAPKREPHKSVPSPLTSIRDAFTR